MRPVFFVSQFVLFVVVASLASCFVPQKIIQIDSGEDEETKWNYGRQVVIVKDGNLEARVFFEDFTKKDLIFDVEVVNLGEEEILLQPEQIHILTDNGGRVWSFDPENEIFGEQVELSRQEARNKNTAVAVVGVAVAATIVAVAASSDGNNSNNDGDGINTATSLLYVSSVVPPPPLVVMPPNDNFWKDYSLRKTTLDQGYKVGGKVVFPRMDESRVLTVVIPVGDQKLKASFKQRIFQP